METAAIGIDLGTTHSRVAVLRNDRVEIIPNEQGNRVTPSCVAFTEVDRFIGEAAVNQIAGNPKNSVSDVKRLIGRKFSDDSVQSDMMLWPFEVVEGDNNQPKIKVSYENEEKVFSPEEITSMVLSKMKKIAEQYLGQTVKTAVVTVPARFNDTQRKATRYAGLLAGFSVVRIINEPTAAAFSYGFDKKVWEKSVLVFDVGGGTCDVSIVMIEGRNFRVKATAGYTHLGGEDLDERLMNHFADEIERKHKIYIRKNKRALWRLKSHCEAAKKVLSSASHADIEITCLDKEFDFSATLTRAKFEDLTGDLLEKFVEPVERCLEDAGMSTGEIDDVVLVGGSTRIPKLRELLAEVFEGKEFCLNNNIVHQDEAVACGAALQAASLSKAINEDEDVMIAITVHDVTPLSLGFYEDDDVMSVVIPRKTPIPATAEVLYETVYDNQTAIRIRVYEGEKTRATDNNLIADLAHCGIPPAPRGFEKISVCFGVDADGILNVISTELNTGYKRSLTIINDCNWHKEGDDENHKAMEAKSSLVLRVDKGKQVSRTMPSSSRKRRKRKEASQSVEGDQLLHKEDAEMEKMIKDMEQMVIEFQIRRTAS